MIDTDKYEGHTEGKWEYDSAAIHATAKGGNEIIAEYPCWNYNRDQLITKEEEANLRLMADAPLLLAEVKRLYELHTLIGVSIPWKVDYGDGGGYDTFVADAVVWNYDDSGEWGLVNYNETRWMTLETAKEWMDKAQQYLESEEE